MDFGTLLHMAKKNSEESKNDVSKENKKECEMLQVFFFLTYVKKLWYNNIYYFIPSLKHVFTIYPYVYYIKTASLVLLCS